jgi:Chitobiase/beta-hexosaminidase C-terminal domain
MKKLTLAGALLALFLVVFPTTPALAEKCDDVTIYWDYGPPTGVLATMETGTPSPRTIFYTTNGTNPTHNGGTPGSGTMIWYGDIPIPYGQLRHYRALCYKSGYDDSNVTYEDISNPVL